MNSTVYLETSIIGYLTSRPSRDLITAANQQLTHDWWNDHRHKFDLFISQFVINECNEGDPVAAQERLDVLAGIRQLDATDDVENLAEALLKQVPLPEKAEVDALHIAIATVHGIEHLLTWNCTHIANAALRTTWDRGNLPSNRIRTTNHLHSPRTDGGIVPCGVIQSSQKSVATGKTTRLGSITTSRRFVVQRASNKKRAGGRLFHCRQDRSPKQRRLMVNRLHNQSLHRS